MPLGRFPIDEKGKMPDYLPGSRHVCPAVLLPYASPLGISLICNLTPQSNIGSIHLIGTKFGLHAFSVYFYGLPMYIHANLINVLVNNDCQSNSIIGC